MIFIKLDVKFRVNMYVHIQIWDHLQLKYKIHINSKNGVMNLKPLGILKLLQNISYYNLSIEV